jgi:hypothetical protein
MGTGIPLTFNQQQQQPYVQQQQQLPLQYSMPLSSGKSGAWNVPQQLPYAQTTTVTTYVCIH